MELAIARIDQYALPKNPVDSPALKVQSMVVRNEITFMHLLERSITK
jgi:hypothetical protein